MHAIDVHVFYFKYWREMIQRKSIYMYAVRCYMFAIGNKMPKSCCVLFLNFLKTWLCKPSCIKSSLNVLCIVFDYLFDVYLQRTINSFTASVLYYIYCNFFRDPLIFWCFKWGFVHFVIMKKIKSMYDN